MSPVLPNWHIFTGVWRTCSLSSFVNPIVVEDDHIQIPQRPGLGVELDMDVVEEHAYIGSEDQAHTITLFEKDWETRSLTD